MESRDASTEDQEERSSNEDETACNDVKPKKDKKKKSKKKDKKRKYSSSSDYHESDEKIDAVLKSKHKKKCKKRHRHTRDKRYRGKDPIIKCKQGVQEETPIGPEVPNELLQKASSMAPMSKEQWEKKRMKFKRVYDSETGRSRLVRGDGEIVEEIVSRERHQEINRQATAGDGSFFQSTVKKCV